MKNFLSKISFKGVIFGALIDVGGTNIWGILLMIYIMTSFNLNNISGDELTNRVMQITNENLLLNILNMIVGGGFVVLGGYIASRIAKKHILLNATLASFLCVLFTFLAFFDKSASQHLGFLILALFVNPLLALLGGYLYLWQTEKKNKNKKSH